MFRQILCVQWKSGRIGLLPLALVAFGLPLLSVQGLGPTGPDATVESVRVGWLIQSHALYTPLFPFLAFLTGTVFGLNAWNWDHRGGHVYALTLPVARWEYVLMKMGAGAILLLGVTAAFGIGSIVAASAIELPAGLRAYPVALMARFLLAAALSYALLFALASATFRTVVVILSAFVALFILAALLSPLFTEAVPGLEQWTLPGRLYSALVEWPGPFQVFLGNWMLVDV